jgi:gliding motility-associated-like protein
MFKCKHLLFIKLLPLKRLVLLSIFILFYTSRGHAQCPTLKDSICRCKDSVPPPQYLRNGSFEDYKPTPCPDPLYSDYSYITGSQYPYYWTYGVRDELPHLYVLGCTNNFFSTGRQEIYPPPLPLPDGKVLIGFVDLSSDYYGGKGYIATCLASTLQANTKYSFEFYLGFSPADSRGTYFKTPYEIVIYGNPSCDSIPFGYNLGIGCPTNTDAIRDGYVRQGWIKLGSVYVSGKGGWVKARIDFVPPKNINGFIFGPNCEVRAPETQITYFHYADNFSLTETSQLKFRNISADSGNCSNGILLHAPPAVNVKAYQWYKDSIAIAGASDSVYRVAASSNASGNYQVRIVFSNSCILSDPFNVDLSLFGNVPLGDNATLCYGQTTALKPNIKNIQYLWQDGSTRDSFLVQKPGTYTVQLTNQYGCSVTKSITINFEQCSACNLFVPSAFTPNSDGTNDVFRVKTLCGQIDNFHLKIYNRWGQSIFNTSDIAKGWDGTYKDELQPTGTYVYFISYKKYGVTELQQQRGVVVLLK